MAILFLVRQYYLPYSILLHYFQLLSNPHRKPEKGVREERSLCPPAEFSEEASDGFMADT